MKEILFASFQVIWMMLWICNQRRKNVHDYNSTNIATAHSIPYLVVHGAFTSSFWLLNWIHRRFKYQKSHTLMNLTVQPKHKTEEKKNNKKIKSKCATQNWKIINALKLRKLKFRGWFSSNQKLNLIWIFVRNPIKNHLQSATNTMLNKRSEN